MVSPNNSKGIIRVINGDAVKATSSFEDGVKADSGETQDYPNVEMKATVRGRTGRVALIVAMSVGGVLGATGEKGIAYFAQALNQNSSQANSGAMTQAPSINITNNSGPSQDRQPEVVSPPTNAMTLPAKTDINTNSNTDARLPGNNFLETDRPIGNNQQGVASVGSSGSGQFFELTFGKGGKQTVHPSAVVLRLSENNMWNNFPDPRKCKLAVKASLLRSMEDDKAVEGELKFYIQSLDRQVSQLDAFVHPDAAKLLGISDKVGYRKLMARVEC